MAFPSDLEVEIAFNNDFDETDNAQSGWTSVLPFVASFEGDLGGREYELGRTETGTMSVTLDNSDGRFLPGSVQSPYYPYVKSDRRLRIRGKNMIHPNVARGGSRDRNTTGFFDYPTRSSYYQYLVKGLDEVRIVTASQEPFAPGEKKENVADSFARTKWRASSMPAWVQYQFAIGVRMSSYILTSANDNPSRDPKTWVVCGSNDGSTWTVIDTVTSFGGWTDRYEEQSFDIDSPNFYQYYRINFTAAQADPSFVQIAEWNLNYDSPDDLLLPDSDLTHYLEVTILAGAATSSWHSGAAWFVPLEYGVRLAHSAYVWRLSGTEPTGALWRLQIDYYDKDWNLLNESVEGANASDHAPTGTTPVQVGFSHTPPADAKYGLVHLDVRIESVTNASTLKYGLTGAMCELPANLAPDISGFRDQYNWQVEGDGDGDYYRVGTDPTTNTLDVEWGANDTNLYTTIPHLIPGEMYTATCEARILNSQPDLQFSGNEGETGPIITGTVFTQYSCTFEAQQPEQELRWILQRPAVPTYDFESGLSNWSVSGGTQALETTIVHSGANSNKLTVSGSPGQAYVRAVAGINALNGQSYTVSMWVYKPVAGNVNATIDWYNTSNVYQSTSASTTAVAANTWTLITVTATAPLAGLMKVGPTLPSSPANGTILYVDDVTVTKAAGAGIVGLELRKLRVERGDNLSLSLPTTAIETGVTSWIRPKDIFEGWIEGWPAVAGNPEMTINVNDRMKRLGDVDLSNTLRESLFIDSPALVLPLSDSMLDTPGRFSQLGNWSAEEGGPSYVDINKSRGDLSTSSYTTSTDDGPTGEASWKNNPAVLGLSGKGYFFTMPYTKDYIAPPPNSGVITKPKPKPPPPKTPTQKSTYTKKWYATWSRSYEGDNSTRFDDSPYMYQGSYDSSSPGNQKSLAGFDYRNIQATLKGADIVECHITIKNAHARWNKGLYATMGTHNYSSKPSTWNTANVNERKYGKKWVTEGGSVTFNVSVQFAKDFLSGAIRGIAIGPEATNDHDHYGYFYGATHSARPYITIKYRK
jgi:hypothetical protein